MPRSPVRRHRRDPALADDACIDRLDAAAMVEDEVFLDRLPDIPNHDERGTRDRPWDYIAHFDPQRIGAALRRSSSAIWRSY